MRSSIPTLLTLLSALGACSQEPALKDSGEVPTLEPLSFAILTDTHIGEDIPDFGTQGWDDSGGGLGGTADVLAAAVQKINASAQELDLRFVVVTGDLTDSGERSELEITRSILADLEIPWVPLLGNHDLWPYCWTGEYSTYLAAEGPVGDTWLLDVFANDFAAFSQELAPITHAPAPVWNPDEKIDSSPINYSFELGGFHFIALDLVSREPAYEGDPGVGPAGDLLDWEGGTLPFLRDTLKEIGPGRDGDTIVFAHHPVAPVVIMGLDSLESAALHDVVEEAGFQERVAAFFAGHMHMDTLLDFEGIPNVLTAATKDKATVRVVHLSDQAADWDEVL